MMILFLCLLNIECIFDLYNFELSHLIHLNFECLFDLNLNLCNLIMCLLNFLEFLNRDLEFCFFDIFLQRFRPVILRIGLGEGSAKLCRSLGAERPGSLAVLEMLIDAERFEQKPPGTPFPVGSQIDDLTVVTDRD